MITPTSTLQRRTAAIAVSLAIAGMAGCDPKPNPPTTGAVPSAAPGAVPPATQLAANPATSAPVPQDGVPLPQSQPVPPAINYTAAPARPTPPPAPVSVQPAPTYVAQAPQPQPQPQYQPPSYQPAPVVQQPAPRAVNTALHGQVVSVEPIREKPQGSGAGAVIGGVLGGVVGNQFGHGGGRTAATLAGAAGGAFAGNTVERNRNERIVAYRVNVRLDNGSSRVYEEPSLDGLRVGDRVRVDGRRLRPA